MSKFKNSFINILCTEAKKSIIGQQLSSVIMHGTKMVCKPCCNTPQNTCRGSFCGSLHAEAHAIVNYFGRSLSFDKKKGGFFLTTRKNRKLDLVVIRVNRLDETCNARPCYNCLNMMKAVGIRRVYYSVSPDKIIGENVNNMVSIQASSVTRYLENITGNDIDYNDPTIYYKKLLVKLFPSIIKRDNLFKFIAHNLSIVLPTYKVKIDERTNIVWILDTDRNPVVKSSLIF